jgi:multidrug resistance efflux pump
MDLILILTYLALVTVIFKVFRIPVNKWSVTTAIFGGALILGWIYISMGYFHPATTHGQSYFKSTPLSVSVRGEVVKIYVDDDRHLKKGDPIFQIDPTPYESKVRQIESMLSLAKSRYAEDIKLQKEGGGSKFNVENMRSEVQKLKDELVKARFDLNSTVVVAPADGHIAHNRLTLGTTAGIFKVSSLITFVPDQKPRYIAAFKPNSISNIQPGLEAWVTFPAKPGKVFKAKVKKVWYELRQGQLLPNQWMVNVNHTGFPARIPVEFEIVDESFPHYHIPVGSVMWATVYSEHLEFLTLLRSILFTMFSWKNILSFDGEGSAGEGHGG